MSTFVPRTRAQIRDQFLANWQARYRAIGLDLIILPKSDAYMTADAVALEIQGLEREAAQLRNEIFPRKASNEGVASHGATQGVPRKLATTAQGTVSVTGVAGATVTFGSSVLQSTGGKAYAPNVSSVVLSGGGTASVGVTCTTAGTDGNLVVGQTLTWSATPTNANPTAAVTAVLVEAVDDESFASWAARIEERMQEHPGSGNRADWVGWGEEVTGVDEAYCYERFNATLGTFVTGCVTLVCLGPAGGAVVPNPRFLSGGLITRIDGYLEGTNDKDGNPTPGSSGVQKRPVAMNPADYFIEPAAPSSFDIVMQPTLTGAYAWPWTTLYPQVSATTTTVVIAGDITGVIGDGPVVVYVGTVYARGGYVLAQPTTVSYSAGNTTLTFAGGVLPTTPTDDPEGYTLYPAPANWTAMRDAAFAYIDSLGPGYAGFLRYPDEDARGRTVFFRSSFAAAVIANAPGVVAVNVPTPASDQFPGVLELLVEDRLVIKPL